MIRVLIISIMLLFVMRVMGKRTLGEMQPFEFVLTLILSDLACAPLSDPAIPLWFGLVPILVLLVVHYFLSFLSRKSFKMRKILDGSPVIVISEEGVEYNALKMLNMSIDDLLDATNAQGYATLADIHLAYFQTNGSLVILPRAHARPVTLADIAGQNPNATVNAHLPHQEYDPWAQNTAAVAFVEDGKLCNLEKLNQDKDSVLRALKAAGYVPKEVVIATADADGAVYLKPREGRFVTLQLPALAHKESC